MENIALFFMGEVLPHVTTAGAGMLIIWLPRFLRRKRLKKPVERAYFKLRMACEPETLNPEQPGNPDFMQSEARDAVNLLVRPLEQAGFYGPSRECSKGDLPIWFCYFGQVRMNL